MNKKHLFIFFTVLLLLIAMAAVKKAAVRPVVERSVYERLEFLANPLDVYAIDIRKAQDSILLRLERRRDRWHIPSRWNVRANAEKVNGLIVDILDMKGELRSDDSALLDDYGISDREAISVSLYDKEHKPLNRFYVGTKRPGRGDSFIRPDRSDRVYLGNTDILYLIGIYGDPAEATITPEMWMDLSLMTFDPEAVTGIRITAGRDGGESTVVDLAKAGEGNGWAFAGDPSSGAVDPKKVQQFLRKLLDLRAENVVDPQGKGYGFQSPYLTVRVGKDTAENTLIIGGPIADGKENRFARTPDGYIFTVNSYALKALEVGPEAFTLDGPAAATEEE